MSTGEIAAMIGASASLLSAIASLLVFLAGRPRRRAISQLRKEADRLRDEATVSRYPGLWQKKLDIVEGRIRVLDTPAEAPAVAFVLMTGEDADRYRTEFREFLNACLEEGDLGTARREQRRFIYAGLSIGIGVRFRRAFQRSPDRSADWPASGHGP
ncbi:MAG TPA: hypothetical protein VGY13_12395 [Solirubrobacteraceae bacterium]|nr:hypothetical protein [Solirubrobacteraceae bacterium]